MVGTVGKWVNHKDAVKPLRLASPAVRTQVTRWPFRPALRRKDRIDVGRKRQATVNKKPTICTQKQMLSKVPSEKTNPVGVALALLPRIATANESRVIDL